MTSSRSTSSELGDAAGGRASAFICSSHINALGIAQSLKDIGWQGRVICLALGHDRHPITEEYPNLCETWHLSDAVASDLPGWLEDEFPESDVTRVVFFTSETFHYQFVSRWGHDPPGNLLFKVGCAKHLDTVLDRVAFYNFIVSRTLGAVPLTISGSEDPWSVLQAPFYLRVRRSWQGITKLPRGTIVNSRSELGEAIAGFRAAGMVETDWAYQEVLSTDPRDNLSVCGWHDDSCSLYFTTRPLVRKKGATAVVVELCIPPGDVLETTRSILVALDYDGPFELEFIRDPRTQQLKVLELNPRFWMQHRLIAKMTDNAVVRRYIGQSMPERLCQAGAERARWVDGLAMVHLLRQGDLKVLSRIGRSPEFHPPLRGVLRYFYERRFRKQLT